MRSDRRTVSKPINIMILDDCFLFLGMGVRNHWCQLKLDIACWLSFITRPELKFRANSLSPLKWTENGYFNISHL